MHGPVKLSKALPCALALLIATVSSALADKLNLQPGNWNVTIAREVEGTPKEPVSRNHCIKADNVKSPQALVDAMKNPGCKVSQLKASGDKLSWVWACDNGASGTAEMTLHGTSYEGVTRGVMPNGTKGSAKMTSHIQAKRIGDC